MLIAGGIRRHNASAGYYMDILMPSDRLMPSINFWNARS
jgi:hypothetical protein